MKHYKAIKDELRINYLSGSFIRLFFFNKRARLIVIMFIGRILHKSRPSTFVFKIFNKWSVSLQRDFNIEIPSQCDIGNRLYLPHPYCIVINPQCKIGHDVTILQGVTLGNTSKEKINAVPKVGNHVLISAGAKVIGSVILNDNVVVGANAVVTKSFPESSTVVGVPARAINQKKK